MLKQINSIFTLSAALLWVLLTCNACTDETIEGGNNVSLRPDGNGNVTIQFSTQVPGMVKVDSRAATVDEKINNLTLYLFDQSGFTGVKTATVLTHSDNQYKDGEYTENEGTTYTAQIPEDTRIVHFVADNVSLTANEITEAKGLYEDEFFSTFITDKKTYWGRHTMQQLANGETVVLYRNYAKVKVGTVASDLAINGWTLYYEPTQATVAPFNRNNGNKFDYVLGTSGVTLPQEKNCEYKSHNDANKQAAETNITTNKSDYAYTLFEHTDKGYGQRVCAIFSIKKGDESKYYKIELLEDTEWSDEKKVIGRTPYDIKRNHEYVINFNGITPELGYSTIAEAIANGAANNSNIEVEEVIPEIVSMQHTLRVEEDANGSSTVRYYKDYTGSTTYTIDDIEIYYDGDDCSKNESAIGVNSLKAVWQEPMEGADSILTFTKVGGKEHTYKLSFTTTGFTEGENGSNHYKEGLIRISEQHEHLLSRYVRVYLGPAITFRPLLISSDIPALADERLTVLFNIPDETYLPADLYPIEIRFGSDRVDVEKNLEVDAMKVVFDNTPYKNVLQYTDNNGNTGTTGYNWHANKEIDNDWGYKYVYTIDRAPQKASEQRKRITLRTTNDSSDDFSVVMEGMSTVTGTAIFNIRELEFKMQQKGDDNHNPTAKQRIMIEGGLHETRMVTGYINKAKGSDTIHVIYNLGTFTESENGGEPNIEHIVPTYGATKNLNIWAYYNPDELEPIGYTERFKDAEGNYFVKHQHTVYQNSSKDTISFKPLSDAITNSVVFLTARDEGNYKKYNATNSYYKLGTDGINYVTNHFGKNDYLYTGANGDHWAFRSASAIISLVDKWSFNPAPSTTGVTGSYTYVNEASVDLGTGKALYLRIDQPLGSETVQLKFEADYLTLDADNIPTDSKGNPYYTINNDGSITLASNRESDYCYLRFKTTAILNACTLKMSSTTGSTVQYNDAEISITNSPVTFQGFEFASEDSLAVYGTKLNSIKQVRGALHIVRVLLPSDLAGITKRAGDEHLFSFKMTSNNFDVIEVKNDAYDDYTSTNSGRTHIVYVNTLQTQGDSLCYVDLVLKSKKYDSAESLIFSSDTGEGSALAFYRYITSMTNTANTYPISIQHSLNQDAWTDISQPLYNVNNAGTAVYYKISLPNVGYFTDGKYFDFTFDTDSLEFASIKSTLDNDTTYTDANNNLVYRITPNLNQTTEAILQMKTKHALADAITVDIDPGETVKAETVTSVLKSSNQFSSIQWYATAADAAAVNRGSGVWGSSTTPITLTNNKIEVSDFAKELHLTLKGISGTSINLSVTGDYAFKDGTTTSTYNVVGDSIDIVLVPTGDKNIYDGDLIDGSFTITGMSDDVPYATPSIEVDIRPWVVLSTNVDKYTPYTVYKENGSVYYHGVLIPYGYEYIQSYKRTDAQHATEDISIKPYITWNPEAEGGNGCLVYDVTSNNGLSDWNYGPAANYNSFVDNTSYEFKWKATVAGTPVHAYQPSGNTDVMLESESGNFIAKGNIWYPYTDESENSFTISRLRPLSPFMNDGASQGYIQYSTDGTTWNNILGDKGESDILHAELGWYSSGDAYTPVITAGTKFYIRITIPSIITDDEVSNIAVKDNSGNIIAQNGTIKESDGSRWVQFTVTAPSTTTSWQNLQFYDTRISSSPADTEIGSSAKFNLNFEAAMPELTVALVDKDGNVLSSPYNYEVGDDIYLNITSSSTTSGDLSFELKFNSQSGQAVSPITDYLTAQNDYASSVDNTNNVTIKDVNPNTTYIYHWKAKAAITNAKFKIYGQNNIIINGSSSDATNFTPVSISAVNKTVTATFAFNLGTEGQTATFGDNGKYFASSSVTLGENLYFKGTKSVGNSTQTAIQPTTQDSSVGDNNKIDFMITTNASYKFTPTKISFNTTRYGTDGGKVDVTWVNSDNTTISLQTGISPNRDNSISTVTNDITGATSSFGGTCGLRINLYSLGNTKQVGFSDIIIEGTIVSE